MILYLVRHGQTLWNVEKRMQGQHDSPLTETGIGQAKRVGRLLRAQIVSVENLCVVTSPLGRALQTARLICRELELDEAAIRQDDRLMEADHGDWSGLIKAEVKLQFPRELAQRRENRWDFRFPGGESYADLARRAEAWLDSLVQADVVVLAVTHEMMSRSLRAHYLGLDPEQTLQLAHAHDEVFVLQNGRIDRLSARDSD